MENKNICFEKDIFSLLGSQNYKFNLVGSSIPTSKDVFFRAKQKELVEQYYAARIFLNETAKNDWEHWFSHSNSGKTQEYFELLYKSYFYETALFYYNVVVDLSWTICYIGAEFAINKDGKRVDFDDIMSIEDAYELIRQAEKSVHNPDDKESPFCYLKKMVPNFSNAINMIISFWTEFKDNPIRGKYNFIKHKGKPLYFEMKKFQQNNVFEFYIQNSNGEQKKIVSNLSDVRYEVFLEDSISELIEFDNKTLYSYVSNLFEELEYIVQPSKFVLQS